MKRYGKPTKKGWLECRACDNDEPCLMYFPTKSRKLFPRKYCFRDATGEIEKKGEWKKPEWAKTELTQ